METISRGRYVLRISVFVIALCLAPVAVLAQEASIIGQVTDDTGAVLPGVTVVATSPSLQVPQVGVVTNERGEYRITPLPLGNYTVEYSLEGFQSIRRADLRLSAGFTAKVDVVMKVSTLNETITVSGAGAGRRRDVHHIDDAADQGDARGHPDGTQQHRRADDPGARRASAARLELRHRQPAVQGVRRARRAVGRHGRRGDERAEDGHPGRQSLRLLRHRGIDRLHGRQHRAGADEGIADQRHPQVRRRPVSWQRVVFRHQPSPRIRQRQRRAAVEGRHGRQPRQEPLGCQRRAGRPDHPQQAVVLLLGPAARREGPDVQRVPRRRRDAVGERPVPVLPHRQAVVPVESVEQVHRVRAVRAAGRREHQRPVLVVRLTDVQPHAGDDEQDRMAGDPRRQVHVAAVGRVDLERVASVLFGQREHLRPAHQPADGLQQQLRHRLVRGAQPHDRPAELVQAEPVCRQPRLQDRVRLRRRACRSQDQLARRHQEQGHGISEGEHGRELSPPLQDASGIAGAGPVRDGRLQQQLQGRTARQRPEGSDAHVLGLRAGQLDDEAAVDAESRRTLRARSRVHSRTVPVGVRSPARDRLSGQVLGPDQFPARGTRSSRASTRRSTFAATARRWSRVDGAGSRTTGTPTSCRWRTKTSIWSRASCGTT